MAQCETCGNDYDKAFVVTMNGREHTFDSFECAINRLAPECTRCGSRIIGHGVQAASVMYCGAHCAHEDGVEQAIDRI